jgi:hypothetical protein
MPPGKVPARAAQPNAPSISLAVLLALDLDEGMEPEAGFAENPAGPVEDAAPIFPPDESFAVLLSFAAETAFDSQSGEEAQDWAAGDE